MDSYQLAASVIGSLAWPIAIVTVMIIFRAKLTELMPLLRLKYRDLDISFRLRDAEQQAATLPAQPQPPTIELVPTDEEKDKFQKVARASPRAAILEVRAEIEDELRAFAAAVGLLSPRITSTLGITRLLKSRGVIDHQLSSLLDDLRVLGNRAAHDGEAQFTLDEAIRYRALADTLIYHLNTSRPKGP